MGMETQGQGSGSSNISAVIAGSIAKMSQFTARPNVGAGSIASPDNIKESFLTGSKKRSDNVEREDKMDDNNRVRATSMHPGQDGGTHLIGVVVNPDPPRPVIQPPVIITPSPQPTPPPPPYATGKLERTPMTISELRHLLHDINNMIKHHQWTTPQERQALYEWRDSVHYNIHHYNEFINPKPRPIEDRPHYIGPGPIPPPRKPGDRIQLSPRGQPQSMTGLSMMNSVSPASMTKTMNTQV